MKTFSTSGTGSGQTLSEIESDKIPIYDSMADAEADLANLSEGQIVATNDTGDELAQPVNVVEEGNLHAVSSDAVAESCAKYPDYASGNLITQNVSSYTATEDCYINYLMIASTTSDNQALLIDNVQVTSYDGGTSPARVFSYSGYVKKGAVIKRKDNGNFTPSTLRVFKLV